MLFIFRFSQNNTDPSQQSVWVMIKKAEIGHEFSTKDDSISIFLSVFFSMAAICGRPVLIPSR